jgi:hypothetical protein
MTRFGQLVLSLALLAGGCTASSPYMKPTTYRPAPPPADKAYVVFMRPSDFGSAVRFEVFDGNGRYLGDALPETYFEAELEPGQHWFYADAENAGVLSAQLVGGKRYYVVVRPFMGGWSARVELTALAPRSEDWPKLKQWLAELEALSVDQAAGQAELDARRAEIDEVIAEGKEIWAQTDAEWHDGHSLNAEDGEGTGAAAPAPAHAAPATDEGEPATPGETAPPAAAAEPTPVAAPSAEPVATPSTPAAP